MDFARNERGFCVGFAWNLILFSFVREREGYKHHADCTVHVVFVCVQFYIFSVLGLTRMGIHPISYHFTASLCHLMYVFMFG